MSGRPTPRCPMLDLLGFSLWWDGEVLHLEAEPDTFNQLRQRLGQSHVTPNPARTALGVVRGWVKAYAPAFEDGDVTSVLAITSECGFREGISLMLVQEWWQDAWNPPLEDDYFPRTHAVLEPVGPVTVCGQSWGV